ncbi:MAG TPA: hypothetical protein VGT61_01785 [Thermomicrobiales bacterium]|jgi:hypothetical protein|nr:hypothetical protein [Thermomicrobiales bacterium]
MAAALLLDLLIFLVPAMLIPLGLWRGGPHEVVVGGGILLGWAVSTEWAGAWGGGLASLTGTSPDAMSFVVACALLVVGAGIGHLGGSLMGLPRPEADGRIAGAVLAWLNGVLFLTLALGIYGRQLDGADPMPLIERGLLTQAMIDHQGALLLGIALIVAGLLGTVLWVNAAVGNVYDPTYVPGRRTVFTARPEPLEAEPSRTDIRRPAVQSYSSWPVAPRQRPVNVPHHADAGKVEPDPEPSRFRTALSRIGPTTGAGEPSRRTTVAEMFAQSLPIDLRDRGGRAMGVPDSGRSGGEGPSSARPPGGRATPGRARDARPASSGETTGQPDGADSDDGADEAPAPSRSRARDGDSSQSSIGEWLRIASGMADPRITPDRNDRSARRGNSGDGTPTADGSPADATPPVDASGSPDQASLDAAERGDDAAPRRA